MQKHIVPAERKTAREESFFVSFVFFAVTAWNFIRDHPFLNRDTKIVLECAVSPPRDVRPAGSLATTPG
jgi:hypothetical protein